MNDPSEPNGPTAVNVPPGALASAQPCALPGELLAADRLAAGGIAPYVLLKTVPRGYSFAVLTAGPTGLPLMPPPKPPMPPPKPPMPPPMPPPPMPPKLPPMLPKLPPMLPKLPKLPPPMPLKLPKPLMPKLPKFVA